MNQNVIQPPAVRPAESMEQPVASNVRESEPNGMKKSAKKPAVQQKDEEENEGADTEQENPEDVEEDEMEGNGVSEPRQQGVPEQQIGIPLRQQEGPRGLQEAAKKQKGDSEGEVEEKAGLQVGAGGQERPQQVDAAAVPKGQIGHKVAGENAGETGQNSIAGSPVVQEKSPVPGQQRVWVPNLQGGAGELGRQEVKAPTLEERENAQKAAENNMLQNQVKKSPILKNDEVSEKAAENNVPVAGNNEVIFYSISDDK